ncbi:hypothetical protein Tco_1050934 [Tanacetum coccineum]
MYHDNIKAVCVPGRFAAISNQLFLVIGPRWSQSNSTLIYRPPVNQPVAHQGPAPQTHGVSKTDFERYVTANDAVLRNMQNQGQNLQSQMANLTDMLSKFVTANTASTSGSEYLPDVTCYKPKDVYEGEITLRVGKEAITFNLDQTSKYTADYNHMRLTKSTVFDMACDEYSQDGPPRDFST